MLQVYLACIRPDLQYAAPVWSPHQQGLKDQIEGLQTARNNGLQVTAHYNIDQSSKFREEKANP